MRRMAKLCEWTGSMMWIHARICIGVIHGRIVHIGKAILRRWRGWGGSGMLLRREIGTDSSNMIPRRGTRCTLWLRRTMARSKWNHSIRNRRGSGRGVIYMLETRMAGDLRRRGHGGGALLCLLCLLDLFRGRGGLIFIIVVVALAGKIFGSFVFMGRAELRLRQKSLAHWYQKAKSTR